MGFFSCRRNAQRVRFLIMVLLRSSGRSPRAYTVFIACSASANHSRDRQGCSIDSWSLRKTGLSMSIRRLLSRSEPLTFFALPLRRCNATQVYLARIRSAWMLHSEIGTYHEGQEYRPCPWDQARFLGGHLPGPGRRSAEQAPACR